MIDRTKEDRERLQSLMKSAKFERKGDWAVYSAYKRQIDQLVISSDEYEEAVKKLCKILEL